MKIVPTITAYTPEEFVKQSDIISSLRVLKPRTRSGGSNPVLPSQESRVTSYDGIPNPDRHVANASRDDKLRVQIDLTDGEFAKPKTINLNQIYWPMEWAVDLHLMFAEPTKWTEMIVSLNPRLVIIHAEAGGDLFGFIEHLHKFGIKVGVALLPETTVESVKELIKIADHILIFGGNLGSQGGTADLSQLEKVKQIRAVNPNIEIGWDGGANLENVAQIAKAGVDIINVGSAIQNAKNPAETFEQLSKLSGPT